MSIFQEYSDLIALAKTCLQEENSPWLPSDIESYKYFKSYALQKKSLKEPVLNQTIKKEEQPLLTKAAEIKKAPLKQEDSSPPLTEAKKITPTLPPITKTALKEEQTKETIQVPNHSFELNALKPALTDDLLDVKKTFQALWPNLTLLERPSKSEPKILLLFNEIEKKEMTFLTNLTKALQTLGSAKLLPISKFQKNHYQKLKLIILTKNTTVIREDCIHYFEMPPIAEYLQNPKLKANLWKALKDVFFS